MFEFNSCVLRVITKSERRTLFCGWGQAGFLRLSMEKDPMFLVVVNC